MNEKPELADYGLDGKKLSILIGINSSLSEKKSSLNTISFILTFIFTVGLFCVSAPLFKMFGGFLILGVILLSVSFFTWATGSNLYKESYKKHFDEQLRLNNISVSQFNLWQSNYSKYNSDMSSYNYKEENDRRKKEYEDYKKRYPRYKNYLYKDKQKYLNSNSSTAASNNTFDKIFNETLKETHEIPIEKPVIIKKVDPEVDLVNPYGTLFKLRKPTLNDKNEVSDSSTIIREAISYALDEKNKQIIGEEGELFILEYERKRLIKYDLQHLVDKIEHTSKLRGDALGYDITSYNQKGEKIYIEVKTSVGYLYTPFFVTENEYETRKRLPNYFIYRVYEFDLNKKKGKLYIINPGQDIESFFRIEPQLYKVTPNKADNLKTMS